MKDNRLSFVSIYYRYCYPTLLRYNDEVCAEFKECIIQDSLYTVAPYQPFAQYEFDGENVDIDIYKQDRGGISSAINEPLPENALLMKWADWNDNGEYEKAKLIAQTRLWSQGQVEAALPGYDIAESVQSGLKRERVAIAPIEAKDEDPCLDRELRFGDIRAFRFSFLDGHIAQCNDLQLVSIDVGLLAPIWRWSRQWLSRCEIARSCHTKIG